MLLPLVLLKDKIKYLGRIHIVKVLLEYVYVKSVYSAQKYSFHNLDRIRACSF